MPPSSAAQRHQHGVRGVYYGGDWLEIEDCASKFNIQNGSGNACEQSCEKCPRSRSRNSAAKPDGSYDVVIIGAGCIGAAIARELSKSSVSVLLLEAADDVTQGATKGNSGIVHAGFDDTPGSVRAKYCWKGNQMFPQLDRELRFGYQRNGSLVLATTPAEVEHLHELKRRGEQNGVQRLRVIDREELLQMEPHVSEACIAALHSPDAGNVIPYEFTVALAENAVDNGVEVRVRREVTAIAANETGFVVTAHHWEPRAYVDALEKSKPKLPLASGAAILLLLSIVIAFAPTIATATSLPALAITVAAAVLALGALGALLLLARRSPAAAAHDIAPVGTAGTPASVADMRVGGSGSANLNDGVLVEEEAIRTRFVVNCAGLSADAVAAMIGDRSFQIKPRIGDYLLLNRNQGHLTTCTLFPCPGPLGKGVLVQTTLWGNLILGPTARDAHLPAVMAETAEDIQTFILSKCKKLVPSFDPKEVIHAFSGARAKSSRNDWILEPSAVNARFIHAAGIDSPGLAGAPAVALEVVRMLQGAGLALPANPTFNPNRAPIVVPKDGWKGLRAGPPGAVANPRENVVCKCEKVTEAEVLTALRRSLPIDSTQAIRKRTRAGMGHCQADPANYNCECRVADIIQRELELPGAAVGRRPWPATSSLPQRWLEPQQKDRLRDLMAK